jgi:8-oxo-dGTP pyrophosphatase MutT (NUDIX family)
MPMSEDLAQWYEATQGALSWQPGQGWMADIVRRVHDVRPDQLQAVAPSSVDGVRHAAVLVLVGHESPSGPFVVLALRSSSLRAHPGELGFPGGQREHDDHSPVDTALREAHEELGLDQRFVDPVAVFPSLFIPPSGFLVTPVLASWRQVTPLVPDGVETEAIVRVPLRRFADASQWYELSHPSGWRGWAIDLEQGPLWGMAAELVAVIVGFAGKHRPR